MNSVIDKAKDKCLAAVEHVGAANYPEREEEALEWVEQAFDDVEAGNVQLRAQLQQLDLDREAERHKRIEVEAKIERVNKVIHNHGGIRQITIENLYHAPTIRRYFNGRITSDLIIAIEEALS